MTEAVAPRIYCIPATDVPVVAVLRRGPSDWFHVGRWDIDKMQFDAGAWFAGRIFPRRSDLSPDGRLLCYFAHKPGSSWEHGEAYVAISKLPWLTALHSFGTCGTWTRGFYFSRDGQSDDPNDEKLPIPFGLRSVPIVQFATERRRGWMEASDSPPRRAEDSWDQHRNARIEKRQPENQRVLCVESVGAAGGEFGVDQAIDGLRVRYAMEANGDIEPLQDLQWADWSRDGRLLVATRSGRIQIWNLDDGRRRIEFDRDLSTLEPNPQAPPAEARSW